MEWNNEIKLLIISLFKYVNIFYLFYVLVSAILYVSECVPKGDIKTFIAHCIAFDRIRTFLKQGTVHSLSFLANLCIQIH